MLIESHSDSTPLLVSVPHAGTALPEPIAARMNESVRGLPDTDWHVDRLVAGAVELGVDVLVAEHSRYVIDLNRGSDDQPLYAGPVTGLVPTETFDGEPVYRSGHEPVGEELTDRIERYWRPYHDALHRRLEEKRARFGHAVLFDVHSIRSRVSRLFDGRLPDLNLGTFDGRSCSPAIERAVADRLAATSEFSSVINGRFKGGFITRHYGRPDEDIHALQLEIAQACYMDESRPQAFDPDAARPLMTLLEDLIGMLSRWRPA